MAGRPKGRLSRWWTTKRRVICELFDPLPGDVEKLQAFRKQMNAEAKERAKKC